MNIDNCFTSYIENDAQFLQIDNPDIDKLVNILGELNCQFDYIDYAAANSNLWESIYQSDLYKLNARMIESILVNYYHIEKDAEFWQKNFSHIMPLVNEPLYQRVENEISLYAQIVLTECNESISDDEAAAIYLLNIAGLEQEHKLQYINYLTTQIAALYSIKNKELWQPLIENKLINYTEDNVLRYFFGNGGKLDFMLVEFISKCPETDYKSKLNDETYGDNCASAFFNAVVSCNELNNKQYEAILSNLNRFCEKFSKEEIDTDKIDILIQLKIIRMSSETLLFMRENYKENLMNYIQRNIKEYAMDIINENNFSLDELMIILDISANDEYKIKLLEYTEQSISIIDNGYSNQVETHILQHNYDSNDFPYLVKKYAKFCNYSKEVVKQLAIEHLQIILDQEYIISYELLTVMLSNQNIASDDKWKLLSIEMHALRMNSQQCKECLNILKDEKFISLFDGKRPTFIISDYSERILEYFDNMDWITQYKADASGQKCQAFGKKLSKRRT